MSPWKKQGITLSEIVRMDKMPVCLYCNITVLRILVSYHVLAKLSSIGSKASHDYKIDQ